MERKELEVFSEASNYAVVRMPGRNYPGFVIQGDSLARVVRDAAELLRLAKASRNGKIIEFADAVHRDLAGRLDHYEKVLQAHGINLPYPPIKKSDPAD